MYTCRGLHIIIDKYTIFMWHVIRDGQCGTVSVQFRFRSLHDSNRTSKIKDIHNSWLYCFTNPFELGTRVSLSHRQPNVSPAKMFHQEASVETIKLNIKNFMLFCLVYLYDTTYKWDYLVKINYSLGTKRIMKLHTHFKYNVYNCNYQTYILYCSIVDVTEYCYFVIYSRTNCTRCTSMKRDFFSQKYTLNSEK